MTPLFNFLTSRHEANVLTITLNRPPVNALSREFVQELIRCAEWISTEKGVWLVVVRSSSKVFCAGADLKERKNIPDESVLAVVKGIQTVFVNWMKIPQPVVMIPEGAAVGGGMEFLLAADLVIASEEATFGFPEVSLGIIPAAGGTQRLAQKTSMAISKRWILTANIYSAQEAMREGVIDHVFPASTLESEATAILARLRRNSPLALQQAKRSINEAFTRSLATGLAKDLDLYKPLIDTRDRKEALAAFAEKRPPHWIGR